MNHFKINCLSVLGKKIVPLEIECIQQRRLPYMQIIGGSSGEASKQRERVSAALESSGFRLPSRRITVSIVGSMNGIAMECTDLAVALAVLGSTKAFPAHRAENLAVCGALSLDGRLLPLFSRAPIRFWREKNEKTPLILPWDDSELLGIEGNGGGFRTLAEVIAYLRGENIIGPRRLETKSILTKEKNAKWRWLEGRPLAQRIIPLAVSGGHPLLLTGAGANSPRELVEDARSLLPPLSNSVREEMSSIHQAYGEIPEEHPLREVRLDSAVRFPRFDARVGLWGDLSLAHGGILFFARVGDRPLTLLQRLREPIESGVIRSLRGGQSISQPADWQIVSAVDLCPCGAPDPRFCTCPAADSHRWKHRLEQIRAYFPLRYHLEEKNDGFLALPHEELSRRVARAREFTKLRQGILNDRLAVDECFVVKPWEEEALAVWRSSRAFTGTNLAKVALTVSDLRGGQEVSRSDVLEARHYVPDSFVPAARSGSNFASSSLSEVKSRAMP